MKTIASVSTTASRTYVTAESEAVWTKKNDLQTKYNNLASRRTSEAHAILRELNESIAELNKLPEDKSSASFFLCRILNGIIERREMAKRELADIVALLARPNIRIGGVMSSRFGRVIEAETTMMLCDTILRRIAPLGPDDTNLNLVSVVEFITDLAEEVRDSIISWASRGDSHSTSGIANAETQAEMAAKSRWISNHEVEYVKRMLDRGEIAFDESEIGIKIEWTE